MPPELGPYMIVTVCAMPVRSVMSKRLNLPEANVPDSASTSALSAMAEPATSVNATLIFPALSMISK